MTEQARWRARYEIHKFKDPTGELAKMAKAGASLQAIAENHPTQLIGVDRFSENCLLNEGIDYLWDIVCGIVGSPTLWSSANARVGVGSTATAADPTQTGLLDASAEYAAMDATYPSRAAETIEFRGSFADTYAEFAWEEFVVDNGAVSNKTLNRKVASKGTKGAGELWTLRVLITIT